MTTAHNGTLALRVDRIEPVPVPDTDGDDG